jgi:hypothetical protein
MEARSSSVSMSSMTRDLFEVCDLVDGDVACSSLPGVLATAVSLAKSLLDMALMTTPIKTRHDTDSETAPQTRSSHCYFCTAKTV